MIAITIVMFVMIDKGGFTISTTSTSRSCSCSVGDKRRCSGGPRNRTGSRTRPCTSESGIGIAPAHGRRTCKIAAMFEYFV